MRVENVGVAVDGNAVAGLLAEVWEGDMTTLVGVCGCGQVAYLAEAVVELDDVAAIVRCRACTHTLLTVLRRDEDVRVMLGALQELRRIRPSGLSPGLPASAQ